MACGFIILRQVQPKLLQVRALLLLLLLQLLSTCVTASLRARLAFQVLEDLLG
jgi:hypothetical protein